MIPIELASHEQYMEYDGWEDICDTITDAVMCHYKHELGRYDLAGYDGIAHAAKYVMLRGRDDVGAVSSWYDPAVPHWGTWARLLADDVSCRLETLGWQCYTEDIASGDWWEDYARDWAKGNTEECRRRIRLAHKEHYIIYHCTRYAYDNTSRDGSLRVAPTYCEHYFGGGSSDDY